MTADQFIGPRCNIGPDEIARRRRSAIVATSVSVAIAVLLVGIAAPAWARLLFLPVASAAAVTWLQVIHRFCVAFGALGLENFGRLGEQSRVERAVLAADRRRAVRVILEGGFVGLVVTLALVAIPV